jgi:hypothetical protein
MRNSLVLVVLASALADRHILHDLRLGSDLEKSEDVGELQVDNFYIALIVLLIDESLCKGLGGNLLHDPLGFLRHPTS